MTAQRADANGSAPVLIAGGGIGGLATAIALAHKGLRSHLFERRAAFSEDGAGIQIGPNGTRILKELGVARYLEPRVTAPEGLRVRDAVTGRELAHLPLGHWLRERHGSPYWVAHRRDLHAALITAAREQPLISVTTAAAAVGAEQRPGSVALRMDDGRIFEGRALVAADGLWSKLRESVAHSRSPRPKGKSAARAVVPAHQVRDPLYLKDVHIWLAPDAHIVHYPVTGGGEVALVVIADDKDATSDWRAPCDPHWVSQRVGSYAPALQGLVTAPAAWRKWSLHQLPEMPAFAHGRIALLGDAAHPVLPFLAQGAVLALEDAYTLAAILAEEPDVERAFARYGDVRRPRAKLVARTSEMNGRIYHLSGPLAFARDMTMRITPANRLMSGYDWLYGWKM